MRHIDDKERCRQTHGEGAAGKRKQQPAKRPVPPHDLQPFEYVHLGRDQILLLRYHRNSREHHKRHQHQHGCADNKHDFAGATAPVKEHLTCCGYADGK